jgi:hypothetical protein
MAMMDFTKVSILERIAQIEKNFRGTKFDALVDQLLEFYQKNSYKAMEETIKQFPTEEKMLAQLVEKLKNKSVYVTLKKIIENKEMTDEQRLKGVSSLITHVAIEIEQGNKEYKMLLPMLYEKVGTLVYKLR